MKLIGAASLRYPSHAAQNPISAPRDPLVLSQRCHSRASLHLLAALPCLAMRPGDHHPLRILAVISTRIDGNPDKAHTKICSHPGLRGPQPLSSNEWQGWEQLCELWPSGWSDQPGDRATELEMLRSSRESKKKRDWWNHVLPPLTQKQEQPPEKKGQDKEDSILSPQEAEGCSLKNRNEWKQVHS